MHIWSGELSHSHFQKYTIHWSLVGCLYFALNKEALLWFVIDISPCWSLCRSLPPRQSLAPAPEHHCRSHQHYVQEPLVSQKPLLEEAKSFCSLNPPLPLEPKEFCVPRPLEVHQHLTCTQLTPGRAHSSHLCSEHREEIFHTLVGYSIDWNGLNVLI